MSDDPCWTLSATPLGDAAAGAGPADSAALDLVVSGSLGDWLDDLPGPVVSGWWQALGDGRFAVVLRLGNVEVDAVLHREGDAHVGRAVARPVRGPVAGSGSSRAPVQARET